MKTLILGPTFTLPVAAPPDAVADRLGAWIADLACPFEGDRTGPHFQIAVCRRQRRRWSPWLTVEVRAGEGGGAEVFGRFNPSPAIWTGYMLGSLALVTVALGAGMWGAAQLVMREPPTALWAVPACVLVLAAMWGVSAAGQRLAAGEMAGMRGAVEAAAGGGGGL